MKEWKSRERLQQEGFLLKVGMAVVFLVVFWIGNALGCKWVKVPVEKEKIEVKK